MKKKIGIIVISSLILGVVLLSVPLTFAPLHFDYITVSTYTSEYTSGEVAFTFKATAPPSGSEIPNTINLVNYGNNENLTVNIQPSGDLIVFSGEAPSISLEPALEPDHFIMSFDGPTARVTINTETIPEFPPILIIPMFIITTLLAIIYKTKRTSQSHTTN